MNNDKITVIGFGHMGAALVQGLLETEAYQGRIGVVEKDPAKRRAARRKDVSVFKDCHEARTHTNVWLLAVKPQDLADLLSLLGEIVDPRRQWVISIAAGVRTKDLEAALPQRTAVVRAMPNLPAVIKQGITALCCGRWAGSKHRHRAEAIFSTVGRVVSVEERLMDAVTAVSGSGPAYVFHTIECLMEAAQRIGLTKAQATMLVMETVAGSVALVKQSKTEPAVWRQRVTSRGGTTQAALDVLKRKGFKTLWIQAMRAARQRAAALSRMMRRPTRR